MVQVHESNNGHCQSQSWASFYYLVIITSEKNSITEVEIQKKGIKIKGEVNLTIDENKKKIKTENGTTTITASDETVKATVLNGTATTVIENNNA